MSSAPQPSPGTLQGLRRIEPHELATLMGTSQAGIDYIVIDVRRTDLEGDFITSALNLPAQSFYHTLPGITSILSRVPICIFHCNSSNGRGPRCAGWFKEELDRRAGLGEVIQTESVILAGGIKAFATWARENGKEDLLRNMPPAPAT